LKKHVRGGVERDGKWGAYVDADALEHFGVRARWVAEFEVGAFGVAGVFLGVVAFRGWVLG
jgi:hypothetical protein